MHTRKIKNHTVTKFATIVYFVCGKVCSKRVAFEKVIAKMVKNTDVRFSQNISSHKKE